MVYKIVKCYRNDNGQDVYAHHSAIIKKNPAHQVRSLADGELVQFNIVEGEKGLEAADITGVNGGPVCEWFKQTKALRLRRM